jgi:hypothetical protein
MSNEELTAHLVGAEMPAHVAEDGATVSEGAAKPARKRRRRRKPGAAPAASAE